MTIHASDNARLGILLMIGFCALAPMSDALVKYLGSAIPLLQVVFFRFLAQLLLVRPKLWRDRKTTWATKDRFGLIVLRSVLHLIAIACFFLSLRFLPLADALAIAYVMPFLILGVGWATGDRATPWKVFLCLIGFIGTLMVVQPSFAAVGWPALLPIAVAVLFTGFMFITRRISQDIEPVDLQAINGVIAVSILVPLAVIGTIWNFPQMGFVSIDWTETMLLLGVGILGTLAHLCMTWSLKFASAPTVAPVQYLEIPFGACFGWMLFQDIPNGLAATGIVITIVAGLLVLSTTQKQASPE